MEKKIDATKTRLRAWRRLVIAAAVPAGMLACGDDDPLFTEIAGADAGGAAGAGAAGASGGMPGTGGSAGSAEPLGDDAGAPDASVPSPDAQADSGSPAGPPPPPLDINLVAFAEATQAVVVAHAAVVIDNSRVTATIPREGEAVVAQATWAATLVRAPEGNRVDFFLERGVGSRPLPHVGAEPLFPDIAADPRFPLAGVFQGIMEQLSVSTLNGASYALVPPDGQLRMAVSLQPRDSSCDPPADPGAVRYASYPQVTQPPVDAPLNVGTGPIGGFLIDPAANAACQ